MRPGETRGTSSTFEVRLTEGGSSSTHTVTLSDGDLDRLGNRYASPEAFIKACFSFLLARETKEQILRSFDVAAISTYFPEFERMIATHD